MVNTYKDYIVWQKSIDLVIEVYKLTKKFPKEELYGLTSQMRRAAVSIPSNIAEGYCRRYRQEFKQFIRTSYGSGAELETQMIIAKKLILTSLKDFENVDKLLLEVMKMLNSLNSTLTSNS